MSFGSSPASGFSENERTIPRLRWTAIGRGGGAVIADHLVSLCRTASQYLPALELVAQARGPVCWLSFGI